jgi:hypothetical protein
VARCGIIIAAMLTLVGDNGGGDQVPAPPQPPSRPAQISMNAADWVAGQDNLHALVDPTFSMFSFAVCDRRPTRVDLADAPSATQENEACGPPLSFSR